MISGILKVHSRDGDCYRFSVRCEKRASWHFTFKHLENAKLHHMRIVKFDSIVRFIFERIKTGTEYKELEPTLNTLAGNLNGSWPLDFLYHYLNQLFLLSESDEIEWFCHAAFYKLIIYKDLENLKPPVILRYEEKFSYIEKRLEQDGRWRELAFVQVARDTGFRMSEMESIEWDDIQFPRIELREPRKTVKEPSYGVIRDKTYATLQKLERASEGVFGKTGGQLQRVIRKYADDNTIRISDYRHCYALRMIWEEIIHADDPEAKGADVCEKQ